MNGPDSAPEGTIVLASSGARRVPRGIETWAIRLAGDLNRQGVAARLYVGGPAEASHERQVPSIPRDHLLLRGFRSRRGWYRRIRIEAWTFACGLVRLLPRHPVVVHVGEIFLASALLRLRRLGRWNGRLIHAAQTRVPERVARNVDVLQALTPDAEAEFRAIRGGSPDVVRIPNYVNPADFSGPAAESRRRLGIPENAFVILSVGAVARPYKRMDVIVEAFRQMRSGSETLVIAGAREDSSRDIERKAGSLGDSVRILYDLPAQCMPALYAASDCFVLASLRETFGIVFLEAMASGLPVVAHGWPATRWILGPAGKIVDARAAEGLGDAIRTLKQDGEERARLGLAGRKRVREEFSRDVVLPRLIDLYRRALADLS